jgi:hypothetical protein
MSVELNRLVCSALLNVLARNGKSTKPRLFTGRSTQDLSADGTGDRRPAIHGLLGGESAMRFVPARL